MPLHKRSPLEARQFVTKTVEQGSDASASVNTGAASTGAASSGSSNKGFPVAVAIPALIGGMAIAILGALGWWWYSRKKSRERRGSDKHVIQALAATNKWERSTELLPWKKDEDVEKRMIRKHEEHRKEIWERKQRRLRNKAASARPSMSASRGTSENATGPAPPAIGMNRRGEKDDAGKEGVPPVPTLDKEAGYGYGQPAHGYGYGGPAGQTAYGYNAITSPPAAARNIDYSQQRTSPTSPISPRGYADQYIAAIAEEEGDQDPYGDQHEVDLKEGADGKESHAPEAKAAVTSSGKPSRSTKRVEAAESAAAREHGDPNERWKPTKPSPLAAAKAQEQAAAAAAAASAQQGGYTYGNSYGQSAGYADDHLDASNGPSEGLIVSHDPYNGGHAFDQQQQQQYGYASTERASGQWSTEPQVQNGQATSPVRGQSGQYSTDPYAGYHAGDRNKRWV